MIRRRQNTLLFFLLAFLLTAKMYSQNSSIDKVATFDMRHVNAIEHDGIVTGYYFMYTIDRSVGDQSLYALCVFDTNLKQIHYKEIQKSKKIYLLEAKSNEEDYCFHFFNPKEKRHEFVIYNSQLVESGNFFLPLTKEFAEGLEDALASPYGASIMQTHTIVPVKDFGFALCGNNFKTGAMEVKGYYYNGREVWTSNFGGTKKDICWFNYVGTDSSTVVFETNTADNWRSKAEEIEKNLCFVDRTAGVVIANMLLKDPKNYITVSGYKPMADNTYMLYGEYYNRYGDQEGIFVINKKADGETVSEAYIPVKKEAKKFVTDPVKLDLLEYKSVVMRKIFSIGNKTFAVGEIFSKSTVFDIVVFEIENNALSHVHFLNKKKTDINYNFGVITTIQGVGHLLKSGLFLHDDYCYTSIDAKKGEFTTVYCDYEKNTSQGDFIIGVATYKNNGELVVRKVKLTTQPSEFTVLPAKPGYVAVFEYFKKEKRVAMHFEKVKL